MITKNSMKKIPKKSSRVKRIVSTFGIPLLLFCAGTILFIRYIVYSDFSFTVLSHYHDKGIFKPFKSDELHNGQSIRGSFTASDNYLGIVALRFNTFDRKNDDIITFRIKESRQNEWYSKQSYRTTLEHDQLYNFGFPLIADSYGKSYTFELLSTRGKRGDAIALSEKEPVAATKYKYSRHAFMVNKSLIPSFYWTKFVNEFLYSNVFFYLIVFFLPVAWYMLRAFNRRYAAHIGFAAAITLIAYSILFLKKTHDEVTVILTALTALSIDNKDRFRILLLMALLALLASALLYGMGNHESAISAASWVFMFLVSSFVVRI